jgi:acetoin utilization deacetylase AcuC-like enzyme
MRGDPTGSFGLRPDHLATIATTLGSLGMPLLVVQEGGYSLRNLRTGSLAFFRALSRSVSRADALPRARMSRY